MTNVRGVRSANADALKERAHRDLFAIRRSSFVIRVICVAAACCR